MTHSPYTVVAIVAVTVATVAIGAYGLRLARTTSDLLVASRSVSPNWNAGRWPRTHPAVPARLRPGRLARRGPRVRGGRAELCPLLLLGIWWRGLTDVGAAAGILVGGGAAVGAVLVTVLGPPLTGWPAALVQQPAAWTVPLAFATMVAVSYATRHRTPADVGRTMLRLHAPDALRI